MTQQLRSRLVAHGALLFLAGMTAGFPYAFEISVPSSSGRCASKSTCRGTYAAGG